MSKHVQILLKKKDSKYFISPTNLSLPLSISWTELNQTLLALLKQTDQSLADNAEFDFLINDQLLSTSLQDFIASNVLSTEQQIEIEYIDRRPPPSQPHILPHPDWVSSLALSDRQVLTGSYDGHVKRWDLDTCSLTSEYKCHEESVTAVAPITDNLTATASSDESVCVWQGLQTGESSRRLLRGFHSQPITCLACYSTRVCSASWDRTLRIWSVDSVLGDAVDTQQPHTMSPVSTLEGHTDVVSSCVWCRDTSRVVSCSWDQNVIFWDTVTQQDVRVMSSSKAVLCVSENIHTGLLATGGSDNIVRVWNTSDEAATVIKLVLKGHTGWVPAVSWSHKSEHHLISGSYDGSIKHWDIRNNKAPVYTVGAHKKKLLCMDWRDGEVVVSGGEDSRLIVSRF